MSGQLLLLGFSVALAGSAAMVALFAGAKHAVFIARHIGVQRAAIATQQRMAPRLPTWLRVIGPVATLLAVAFGPRIPLALRRPVHAWLRSAELEESLTAEQWIGVCIVTLLGAAIVAGLLSAAPLVALLPMLLAAAFPWLWLRDAIQRRKWQVLRDLPMYVDILTLALEAGGALSVALQVATERTPDSPLRRAFVRLQLDLRAGRARADALRTMDARVGLPAFTAFVAAMIQAETRGGSLSAALRAQSEQRLDERFARAEKLAMEAPVKMLGPLILCIFPCTFIVLAFPIVSRFLGGG